MNKIKHGNAWMGGGIHSNHFQMKMIIYNNENKTKKKQKTKSPSTSSNKEQTTEMNTTQHFLPIFTQAIKKCIL